MITPQDHLSLAQEGDTFMAAAGNEDFNQHYQSV